MFLPQRWRRQPNRPVEVDYKNPITDSIWCAWNCHLTHDAVTGSGKFTTGGFGVGRARGVRVYRGEALHCSAPGLLAYLNTDVPGARADAPLTMLAGACALSAGGMIFGCDCWSLRTTGANLNAQTLRVRLWPGALDHDSTATIDLSDTRRLQQIGFTWVPSTTGGYQPYFNGSPVGSAVDTSTTTEDPIPLGWNSDGTGSGAGEGMYAWIFGWKRVLLAAEIAELNLNPWQIFRPVLERHIVLPSMHTATKAPSIITSKRPTPVNIDVARLNYSHPFFGDSSKSYRIVVGGRHTITRSGIQRVTASAGSLKKTGGVHRGDSTERWSSNAGSTQIDLCTALSTRYSFILSRSSRFRTRISGDTYYGAFNANNAGVEFGNGGGATANNRRSYTWTAGNHGCAVRPNTNIATAPLVWVDGRSASVSASGGTATSYNWGGGSAVMEIGYILNGGYTSTDVIALVLAIEGILPESVMAALSLNPYEIFEQHNHARTIFIPNKSPISTPQVSFVADSKLGGLKMRRIG